MAGKTLTPIGDAISDHFDSHGIYDRNKAVAILQDAGWPAELPQGSTNREMFAAIEGRGLGGELKPEAYKGQRLIAGYTIAEFVARHIDGADITLMNQLMGRGSRFRAAVAAIRDAERNTVS
jgi:hypothetical protein